MGTIEMVNLGMSVFGGAGLTMAGRVVNTIADVVTNLSLGSSEALQKKHDQDIEKHGKTEESQGKARSFFGTKGFHSTRQWIAKRVINCYFVLPMLLPVMAALFGIPIEIEIGYYDISRGWPWQESIQNIEWHKIGVAGGIVIVITPVMNNAVITIIGMFFGNQITKR